MYSGMHAFTICATTLFSENNPLAQLLTLSFLPPLSMICDSLFGLSSMA